MKSLDDLFEEKTPEQEEGKNTDSEEQNKETPPVVEKDGTDSKKKEGEEKEEGKNSSEEEGETKEEGEEGEGDKNKETPTNEDSDDFWGEVAKLSGEELDIDFGDVDPTTPEGALKYAQAYREKGLDDFFTTLKEKYPREHRALELVAEGYDPSSLYAKVSEKDYTTFSLKGDMEYKEVLLDYCKFKGLDDETSRDLIESAENKGNLKERAESALTALKSNQEELKKAEALKLEEKVRKDQEAINDMASVIQAKIQSGNIDGFNIPEKDKASLLNAVYGNIQIVNGEVLYVKKLTKDSLDRELQAEYLKLKKGNLNDIVLRVKETKQTLKLQSKKEKEITKNAETKTTKTKVKTLDDLFN